VREGDAGAGPGQDTLGRRDDVLVDRRRVGGLPRPAAEGPAAVRKRSAYAGAFARRRRERDRVAHEPGELDETEHQQDEDRRQDERELDQPLSILAASEPVQYCGSARAMALSVKVTPVPVMRANEVSQVCW